MANIFKFHHDLFELKNQTIEVLQENDIFWFTDYGSIDLVHDEYGLEVCSIKARSCANRIERILKKLFPDWPHCFVYFDDINEQENGWTVRITRDPESYDENWKKR